MTTSINEARIGGLQQNFQLVVGIFLVQVRKKFFLLLGGILTYLQSFPKKLGERGRAYLVGVKRDNSYLVVVKSKIKVAWTFWVIWGMQGWHNSGRCFLGHCFVLRDLIPVQLNLISVSRDYETKHVHHRQNFW